MPKAGWLKSFFARFYNDGPEMLMPALKDAHPEEEFHEQERKPMPKTQHTAATPDDGNGDDGGGDDGGGVLFVPPHG
jgi:hypothetical protein